MHIIWKPQAEKDLEAIEKYYLKIASEFAEIIIDEALARIRKLENSPRSGRKVLGINDSAIREFIYRNTILFIIFQQVLSI